jgi:hypothetical protein
MSKETKFLSIAIGLLQGIMKESGNEDPVVMNMDAERLYNFTRFVDVICGSTIKKRINETDHAGPNKRNTFHRNGIINPHVPLGEIYIETHCNGVGTPAQIKFFKLLDTESPDDYNRVNGKIAMIRDMTGLDGILHRFLPKGRYIVEVSKGSEYEIFTDYMLVIENELEKRNYELNRFVDLEKEGWIAGDLHHHSIYSGPAFKGEDDVVESPAEVANSMMAMGLSYGALSDHNNVLSHGAWAANKREDFLPIISKEISTSNGHVMAMGVHHDVIYKIPEGAERTDEYLRKEFIRIADEIKRSGGLAQLNHPRDGEKALSWNPAFDDILNIFETMEIWNGSAPMLSGSSNDKALELWQNCMKNGIFIPATAGSDTHNICINDYHILFDELLNTRDLIQLNTKELSERYPEEVVVFSKICDTLLPTLEKWAETNIGSGGVRTYVNVGKAGTDRSQRSPELVMEKLRKGNSFLTNGPILYATVNGAQPGEKIQGRYNELKIDIKLLSNRTVKKLYLCTEYGQVKEIQLKSIKKNGHYDYSCTLRELAADFENDHYLYFKAESDCTNMAITNPVILR